MIKKQKNQVTAVLPARNCRKELAGCLRALEAGDCPPEKLIIVDDGSDDGTSAMVREKWPGAVLLRVPVHTGFAHAANIGLRLVQTEYALLIRPELQPGKKCVRRLLEALEAPSASAADPGAGERAENGAGFQSALDSVFCAVPEPLRRADTGRRSRRPMRILAVPDGCAMYRMKALEEIGWFDERHFDGLEALDLSLRAASCGLWTLQVPGAYVRPAADHDPENAYGVRMDTFRRQLAAGNGLYVLYKHIPALQRFLSLPAVAAAQAAQRASFAKRGELDAYRMARVRGKALCSLEKERRAAKGEGVSVWAENLPDASFLGMEEAAERIYPLYLAEKEPFSLYGIPENLLLQGRILRSLNRIFRLMQ